MLKIGDVVVINQETREQLLKFSGGRDYGIIINALQRGYYEILFGLEKYDMWGNDVTSAVYYEEIT